MKPGHTGVVKHKIAEIDASKHVSPFLIDLKLIDDRTVFENLKVESMARSCAPLHSELSIRFFEVIVFGVLVYLENLVVIDAHAFLAFFFFFFGSDFFVVAVVLFYL